MMPVLKRCLCWPQDYKDTSSLRYGHIMIMTDQDHDGSHIKGLLMNFMHHFYPSLLKVPGFLIEFITPIVKARSVHFACAAVASGAFQPGTCICEQAIAR